MISSGADNFVRALGSRFSRRQLLRGGALGTTAWLVQQVRDRAMAEAAAVFPVGRISAALRAPAEGVGQLESRASGTNPSPDADIAASGQQPAQPISQRASLSAADPGRTERRVSGQRPNRREDGTWV